jgi:hypothetical protein
MDIATIILSIVCPPCSGWLAGADAYTASGRSTGFVWKLWSGLVFLRFFFLFKI